jgi:hypothetical protein
MLYFPFYESGEFHIGAAALNRSRNLPSVTKTEIKTA